MTLTLVFYSSLNRHRATRTTLSDSEWGGQWSLPLLTSPSQPGHSRGGPGGRPPCSGSPSEGPLGSLVTTTLHTCLALATLCLFPLILCSRPHGGERRGHRLLGGAGPPVGSSPSSGWPRGQPGWDPPGREHARGPGQQEVLSATWPTLPLPPRHPAAAAASHRRRGPRLSSYVGPAVHGPWAVPTMHAQTHTRRPSNTLLHMHTDTRTLTRTVPGGAAGLPDASPPLLGPDVSDTAHLGANGRSEAERGGVCGSSSLHPSHQPRGGHVRHLGCRSKLCVWLGCRPGPCSG